MDGQATARSQTSLRSSFLTERVPDEAASTARLESDVGSADVITRRCELRDGSPVFVDDREAFRDQQVSPDARARSRDMSGKSTSGSCASRGSWSNASQPTTSFPSESRGLCLALSWRMR
jgi:hypothetical protein